MLAEVTQLAGLPLSGTSQAQTVPYIGPVLIPPGLGEVFFLLVKNDNTWW